MKRPDRGRWYPRNQFVARIETARQLQVFNDRGGIAVDFDVMRSVAPEIEIAGSQSETLSLWETRSASGFVTRPKFNADLVTVRFVTSGHVVYRHPGGDAVGLPTHATLVGFEHLREVRASGAFSAISGTIAVETLRAAQAALTGDPQGGLPPLALIAEVADPGMRALFCTMRQVQRRSRAVGSQADLVFPLIQEILGYQLLTAWPRREPMATPNPRNGSSRGLASVLDYIEANLAFPLTLADIASAGGVSVRTLQNTFRREVGRTPVQFLIERRLARVHRDLVSARDAGLSVADIAGRWGFVHMSDFGQRYRRLYGCTPSETRRRAHRGR